jgi:phosphoribosylglycinamide formyltransferase-1
MLKLGVLASGRGSNLQAIIEAIVKDELDAQVAVVISDRPDAQVLDLAKRYQIPAVYLDPKGYSRRESYDDAVVEALIGHAVELVLLAGYMRIVTRNLIEPFRNRIMNIHPAILPAFPGLHAQRQAVQYGVKLAGCSVHFVDETVDGGPVIIQAAVPVLDDDTEETLSTRILEQEHRIYPHAVRLFAEGRLRVVGRKVTVSGGSPAKEKVLVNPAI